MTHLQTIYEKFDRIGSGPHASSIDYRELFDASTELVEATIFALPEDLFQLLQTKNSEEILLMPFWYRTMAFRILVAKAPWEESYIKAAITDLQMFGPIYDPAVEEYKKMLKGI